MTQLEEKSHEKLVSAIWSGFQDEGLTLADLIGKRFIAGMGGETVADEPKFTAIGTILGFYIEVKTNKTVIYTTVGLFVHHDGAEYIQYEGGMTPSTTLVVPPRAWFEWTNWKSKK